MAWHTLLEEVVREALKTSLQMVLAVLSGDAKSLAQADVVHQVFLVGPRRVEDENDDYRTASFEWRQVAKCAFVSPTMARIAMELVVSDRALAMYRTRGLGSGEPAPSSLAVQLFDVLMKEPPPPADQVLNL